MGISLRRATLDDLKWILIELRKFSEFYSVHYQLMSEDNEINENIIKLMIENHFFVVALVDDNPAGFIVGLEHNHLFNPSLKVLTEAFWWVKPEFRNSKVGACLLKDFENHGKNFNWVVMTIEDATTVKPESFLKRGFRLKEQSFVKENF